MVQKTGGLSLHTYLDADGETLALPERLLPVVIVVLLHHWPPAQHRGGRANGAVANVLTGWSVDLRRKPRTL